MCHVAPCVQHCEVRFPSTCTAKNIVRKHHMFCRRSLKRHKPGSSTAAVGTFLKDTRLATEQAFLLYNSGYWSICSTVWWQNKMQEASARMFSSSGAHKFSTLHLQLEFSYRQQAGQQYSSHDKPTHCSSREDTLVWWQATTVLAL